MVQLLKTLSMKYYNKNHLTTINHFSYFELHGFFKLGICFRKSCVIYKEAANRFQHFSNSHTLMDEHYYCLTSDATIL